MCVGAGVSGAVLMDRVEERRLYNGNGVCEV